MASQRSGDESKALEDLRNGIEDRNGKLASALAGFEDTPKWEYPDRAMDIIKQAQAEASKYEELVCGRLTQLLEWPTKQMAGERKIFYDEDFFYEAKGPNSMFDRNKEWLAEQGFHGFKTQYSFSDRWDKQPLHVTIWVPMGMKPKHIAPVMWFFHGGGFVRL